MTEIVCTPPLKWHGGKSYLAKTIIDLMPAHMTFVEPYAGGLAVLLAKPPDWRAKFTTGDTFNVNKEAPGVSEIVNDIDGRLTNFWKTLQDPALFERFRRRLEATPHSQVEWEQARTVSDDPILEDAFSDDPILEDACRLMILHRQSRGGMGQDYQTPSRRPRRRMNEHASAWMGAIAGLPDLHQRLLQVQVLNRPALDVIRQTDGPHTLFYLDPPYVHETRTATKAYRFEMTNQDHRDLLATIKTVQGSVILSGYANDLYNDALSEWNRVELDKPNNAAGGRTKRRMTEILWFNFGTAAS